MNDLFVALNRLQLLTMATKPILASNDLASSWLQTQIEEQTLVVQDLLDAHSGAQLILKQAIELQFSEVEIGDSLLGYIGSDSKRSIFTGLAFNATDRVTDKSLSSSSTSESEIRVRFESGQDLVLIPGLTYLAIKLAPKTG